MLISLKIRVESTAKTPVTARRARGGGLCGFSGTAGRVPTGNPKTGAAPPCGSVGGKHRNRTRWPREKPLAANAGTRRNGQNREILDAAARKQEKGLTLFCVQPSTSARSAGSFVG